MIHERSNYEPEKQIPADEPVFLLRAQDVAAAETVRFWVKLNRKFLRQAKDLTPEQRKARQKNIVMAEAHAHRMDDWPVKKIAD